MGPKAGQGNPGKSESPEWAKGALIRTRGPRESQRAHRVRGPRMSLGALHGLRALWQVMSLKMDLGPVTLGPEMLGGPDR